MDIKKLTNLHTSTSDEDKVEYISEYFESKGYEVTTFYSTTTVKLKDVSTKFSHDYGKFSVGYSANKYKNAGTIATLIENSLAGKIRDNIQSVQNKELWERFRLSLTYSTKNQIFEASYFSQNYTKTIIFEGASITIKVNMCDAPKFTVKSENPEAFKIAARYIPIFNEKWLLSSL